ADEFRGVAIAGVKWVSGRHRVRIHDQSALTKHDTAQLDGAAAADVTILFGLAAACASRHRDPLSPMQSGPLILTPTTMLASLKPPSAPAIMPSQPSQGDG
ncbi:MAG: hypothetical protein ACJ8AW_48345, partial [Rhodopila sp.]